MTPCPAPAVGLSSPGRGFSILTLYLIRYSLQEKYCNLGYKFCTLTFNAPRYDNHSEAVTQVRAGCIVVKLPPALVRGSCGFLSVCRCAGRWTTTIFRRAPASTTYTLVQPWSGFTTFRAVCEGSYVHPPPPRPGAAAPKGRKKPPLSSGGLGVFCKS